MKTMDDFKGTLNTFAFKGEIKNADYDPAIGNIEVVAKVYMGFNESSAKEAEANIKLLAASKDLLEACIEFCRKVEAGEAKSTKSYNQMKAAINKAL